ncbi:IclR family transcriptional regulator [Prauserella cavernicola]|uniref:Glycerol operon regulatory protein n=1 Tax=Prauserella cavernicola TaxID=2800127 RepID=A0A934QVH0_9PSEU|nr:IclR family transcriptional regulator [Prauserella cavernicola]MBK1787290.1 IclR family transcriptional regulator [Prauserella cavernicola]
MGTLEKTGRVLELFSADRPEWGVTELAEALGIPKSNAHELLSSLFSINLLQRTKCGRYRLGWRIISMANSMDYAAKLRQCSTGLLRELARSTGQTTHLAVWDGEQQLFIGRAVTEGSLDQGHAQPGAFVPAYCTASGKVLLSEMPWREVEQRVAKSGFVPRTVHTIRSLAELRDELRVVSSRGYGLNQEEVDLGVCSIAAPVRGKDGHAIAAVGVSVRTHEFDDFLSSHVTTVLTMAARLSRAVNTFGEAYGVPPRVGSSYRARVNRGGRSPYASFT